MSDFEEYSRDAAIAEFFNQTCATRASCDNKALKLVGGKVVPVEVQGVCSYTVYAGPQLKYVVQFRLNSLKLDTKTATLATEVYEGDETGKGSLLVYVIDRTRGLRHLDFILEYGYPQNSESSLVARKNLTTDIARFMVRSWNAPQEVSSEYRGMLAQKYNSDRQLLLTALPERFHVIIRTVLEHLDSLLSLPMVLLHRDFGTSNILVNDRLATSPTNEIGKSLTQETKKAIETSRVMGLLLSRGFTKRLANAAPSTPISDDSAGSYNMLFLDGLLLKSETKPIGL
ncbi:hypothetical protein BU16DRAFT_590927 [Lophium mytilinum]|uniref:Uncharacterized protein n=1 Tax=Lophium mytilinum TaxID=390894 RepID=A0A6A6QPF7_9PEZI|nr:hypothetical protein BU16DRAFT_590927 [Lophium mytilinum]